MDCVYHNDYYAPDLFGACTVEVSVPEGCPLHVVTPRGDMLRFEVIRGDQPQMLASTTTAVDPVTVQLGLVDVFSCDCARYTGAVTFDRYEIAIPDARGGDAVVFDAGKLQQGTMILIDAAGPCPAATWPTSFIVATRCDLCPQPVDDDAADDSEDTVAGCSVGSGAGVLAVLGALFLVAGRRRSAR